MNISISSFVFYGFALIAIASAVMVISVRNTVYSVLSLVLTFFATAALWMLLRAEFLSLILVLVYVGAVMTLFLFVVMMLNVTAESRRKSLGKSFLISVFAAALFIATILSILYAKGMNNYFPHPEWVLFVDQHSNTKAMGLVLFTEYVFAFELAGMLLLAAMVAAIALTHRGVKSRKTQSIPAQLNTRREDCVKLVSMPPSRPSSQRLPQSHSGEESSS